jgi:hypothetical protein
MRRIRLRRTALGKLPKDSVALKPSESGMRIGSPKLGEDRFERMCGRDYSLLNVRSRKNASLVTSPKICANSWRGYNARFTPNKRSSG